MHARGTHAIHPCRLELQVRQPHHGGVGTDLGGGDLHPNALAAVRPRCESTEAGHAHWRSPSAATCGQKPRVPEVRTPGPVVVRPLCAPADSDHRPELAGAGAPRHRRSVQLEIQGPGEPLERPHGRQVQARKRWAELRVPVHRRGRLRRQGRDPAVSVLLPEPRRGRVLRRALHVPAAHGLPRVKDIHPLYLQRAESTDP
mmetsp:Transcript_105156/g.307336  ORF Transcript_105156/g.307336 Transcript_105156/m.307336 type:complete len:201 (+) Transcript_105156:3941-4543(+)